MITTSENICICKDLLCTIPYGECHCGCGEKTSIWKQNHTKLGGIKGKPHKYFGDHLSKVKPSIDIAVPFKIEGVYCRLIPLSQGLHTIVWESDYQWLMQWKWGACYYQNTNSYYALKKINWTISGTNIAMQRFILGLSPGDPRTGDHENGNTLDNRRSNLRIVNEYQSSQNRGMRKDNKTGFKGVYVRKKDGKYIAQIRANGQTFYLGSRDTPEEASLLYIAAAAKYHGIFRRQ